MSTRPNECAHPGGDPGRALGASDSNRRAQSSASAGAVHPPSTDAGSLACYRLSARRPKALTKRFDLVDGALVKTSIAQLVEGDGKQVMCLDLADFLRMLEGLTTNAAMLYGIAPGHEVAKVASQSHAKNFPAGVITS